MLVPESRRDTNPLRQIPNPYDGDIDHDIFAIDNTWSEHNPDAPKRPCRFWTA
jgi:hypothetical protein